MTGRQKILSVLKDIKEESEINPDTRLVSFGFNNNVFGPGILSGDEEKRILMKLKKMGVIKIHSPNDEWEKLNQFAPVKSIAETGCVFIEILPSFHRRFFWYSLTSLADNKWNYINLFWILWQSIKGVIFSIEWLWNKSKVAVLILGTLGGFLVYDWSLAWKNLKAILIFLKIL